MRDRGFFQGYSPLVLGVIAFEAAGGIIVAMVAKHADSILKVFATSISIIVSRALSAALFGFAIVPRFVGGAADEMQPRRVIRVSSRTCRVWSQP